jgi:uncharacterized protein involved in tolerance to divalent cations
MLLKTTAAAADRLKTLIIERHPYDTPCVLAVTTAAGGSNLKYAQWVRSEIE